MVLAEEIKIGEENIVIIRNLDGTVLESILSNDEFEAELAKNKLVHGKEEFIQPKAYMQSDSRWKDEMYSAIGSFEQTVGSSGCVPTVCADILATLIDASITPIDLVHLALKWGDRTVCDGTSWEFFVHIFYYYTGFSKYVQTTNISALKDCINAGGYVVCSMKAGYWTSRCHCICAWKYEDGYIYCNDSAHTNRTRQKEDEFIQQSKMYFCFYI